VITNVPWPDGTVVCERSKRYSNITTLIVVTGPVTVVVVVGGVVVVVVADVPPNPPRIG